MLKDIIKHKIKEFQFSQKLIIVTAKCPEKFSSQLRISRHKSFKTMFKNYDFIK